MKKIWTLFTSVFTISAFTFGGGYVIIPLMQTKFVEKLQWIDEEEMLDMVALAQATPGAVAVNASILLGYKVAGVLGAIVSILGTILPPLITISIISYFYVAFRSNEAIAFFLKGLQAGVCAIIVNVVFNLGQKIFKEKDYLNISLMIVAFVLAIVIKINVVLIILLCGLFGLVSGLICLRRNHHVV